MRQTDAGSLTHLGHTVLRFQESEQEPCFSNTPTALCASVDKLNFSELSHLLNGRDVSFKLASPLDALHGATSAEALVPTGRDASSDLSP